MPMSDEQKKAASDRLKAMHERKRQERELQEKQQGAPTTESTTVSVELPTPAGATSAADTDEETVERPQDPDRIARLEAQIELLLKMQGGQPQPNASQKTVEKYSTQLSLYANPVNELMEWARNDRRMQQQAFSANYELQFVADVPPRYQLADGSWERQPKFTLGLLELAYDDNGEVLTRINERGEEVQIKYLRKRLIYFEDPDNALAIAYRKGLQLDDQTSQAFLNDMRFLQAQEWLLDVFYPPKPNQQQGTREEAIDGRMVTIVESPTQWKEVTQDHKLRV